MSRELVFELLAALFVILCLSYNVLWTKIEQQIGLEIRIARSFRDSHALGMERIPWRVLKEHRRLYPERGQLRFWAMTIGCVLVIMMTSPLWLVLFGIAHPTTSRVP